MARPTKEHAEKLKLSARELLKRCITEPHDGGMSYIVRFPQALDPDLEAEAAAGKILKSLGGKFRKLRGGKFKEPDQYYLFEDDGNPEEKITAYIAREEALDGTKTPAATPVEEQYIDGEDLEPQAADFMVSLAQGLRSKKLNVLILRPRSGEIVRALVRKLGERKRLKIDVIEGSVHARKELLKMDSDDVDLTIVADVFGWHRDDIGEKRYDLILANDHVTGDNDIAVILKLWPHLALNGTLVSAVSPDGSAASKIASDEITDFLQTKNFSFATTSDKDFAAVKFIRIDREREDVTGEAYDPNTPIILSGNISPEDQEAFRQEMKRRPPVFVSAADAGATFTDLGLSAHSIPVGQVYPDPDQPRKTIDERALQELAKSITAKGLIQPITVRPDQVRHGFKIVCGERRWRAAQLAGLPEIAAFIRELTDEEAEELQVIENLQRADVHPMQEAHAFRNMRQRMSVEEIAAKIGKGETYVGVRLRLNELLTEFQELFLGNYISLAAAMKLSRAAAYKQQEILTDRAKYIETALAGGEVADVLGNLDWHLKDSFNKLATAPFDTEDPTLNPEQGPCGTCPKNSANGSLFFDIVEPTCMFAACFRLKATRSFEARVKFELEAGTIFVADAYLSDSEKEWLAIAEAAGARPLRAADFSRAYGAPADPGTLEEYVRKFRRWPLMPGVSESFFNEARKSYEWTQGEINGHETALAMAYEEEVATYPARMAAFGEDPRYRYAFSVAGNGRGRKEWIQMSETAKKQVESNLTKEDTAKLGDMEQRADRKNELGTERLWRDVAGMVTGNYWPKDEEPEVKLAKPYKPAYTEGDFSQVELGAMCSLIHAIRTSNGSDSNRNRKLLNLLDPSFAGEERVQEFVVMKQLSKLLIEKATPELLRYLMRNLLADRGFPKEQSHLTATLQATSYAFAREKFPKEVAELELKEEAARTRRAESLAKRMDTITTPKAAEEDER